MGSVVLTEIRELSKRQANEERSKWNFVTDKGGGLYVLDKYLVDELVVHKDESSEGSINVGTADNGRTLHFILDNSHSILASKTVILDLKEEVLHPCTIQSDQFDSCVYKHLGHG